MPSFAGAQSPSSNAEGVATWQAYVEEASQRFDVPKAWINRVMGAESAGRTRRNGRPIVSDAGAMGLMQLMPATYEEMRSAYNLGPDPFDPHDNILAGTGYLRAMFDRFGYPGLFAAYNAGPTRFEASLRGVPVPLETREYLLKVTDQGPVEHEIAPLFVPITGHAIEPIGPPSSALFVVRWTPDTPPLTSNELATPPEAESSP